MFGKQHIDDKDYCYSHAAPSKHLSTDNFNYIVHMLNKLCSCM